MKQSISILGCGWLGEPLARHLIKQGYPVKGSTTSEDKLERLIFAGITSYLIKLESIPFDISKFLDSEIVIVTIPPKNIEWFKNLINEIEKSLVKKVILISSISVYDNSKEIITELSPLKSSSLVKIEEMFKTNSKFSTTVVRFGGLIGHNRKPGKFFPKGKKIENPDGFVNMIHRDDCISIIEQIIKKSIWNETFNACADTHPTRREFYSKAALVIGQDIPGFKETDSYKKKIISSHKLKMMLDFKFKYHNLLDINEENFDGHCK